MPKWNNPQLTEVADEVRKLEETAHGQLILRGDFLDPDLDFYSRATAGVRIASLEAPNNINLVLEGSALLWAVQPVKKTVIEWVPADSKEAQSALPLAREHWPHDIQLEQTRIEGGQKAAPLRSEARTRKELIDPVLEKVGWKNKNLKRDSTFLYDPERKAETFQADYVLFADHPRHPQATAAIIEVKRESFPPDYGLEQGKLYADVLAQNVRYVFATNGREFVQHDRTTGATSAPLPMAKFPRFDALRGLIHKVPESQWRVDKDAFALERFVQDKALDGNNGDMVESIAKLLLPKDDIRTRCFNALTESLMLVNSFGGSGWETTLAASGQSIRLSVGRLDVLTIFRNGLHVVVDERQLDGTQFYEIGKLAAVSHGGLAKTLDGALACDFRADYIETVMPMLLAAHRSLLELAIKSAKTKSGARPHQSAGVIDYLRTLTGRKVPHPVTS